CLVFSGPPPSRQTPTATVICPISDPATGSTHSPTQPTTRMRQRLLGGTPPVAGRRAHTTAATHATGSPTATRADASATTWHSATSPRSTAQPQRRRYHRAPTSTGTRRPTPSPRGTARCRSRPRTQPHRPGRSRTTPPLRGRNPATTTATATAATTAEPRATDATHRPRPCATTGTTKAPAVGGTAAH